MRSTDADRFAAYYAARYPVLRRTAYLLCGNWHEAEELTQVAFVRLYLAWSRVRADGAHAYARRVLVNEFLGRQRRVRERHVLSLDQLAAIVTDPSALRYFPRP